MKRKGWPRFDDAKKGDEGFPTVVGFKSLIMELIIEEKRCLVLKGLEDAETSVTQ